MGTRLFSHDQIRNAFVVELLVIVVAVAVLSVLF